MQANQIKLLRSTPEEYRKLVGIHILTGIFRLPRLRLYYTKGLEMPLVTSLPRDRVFRLRNHLHLVDNLAVTEEERLRNKLWKVEPILQAVRNKCVTLPISKHLSIDEQMIPFSGTTGLKQFVKNKPNPVGIKIFVLASPAGLLLDFFIYQGAKTWPNGTPEPGLGIGGSVVKRLSTRIPGGHILYFDRYFTSLNLLDYLHSRDIAAVGTILNSRLPANLKSKLKTDKELQKEGRGSFEEWVREDNKCMITKWMDNRSVLVASSSAGTSPVTPIRRWDKKTSKYVLVPRPHLVGAYNESMGGVDLNDRMLAYYRISMRTKKWTVKVFFHFIDLALINSWIEYRQDRKALGSRPNDIMDLLDFKAYVAKSLILGASTRKRNFSHAISNEETLDEDGPSSSQGPKRRRIVEVPPHDARVAQNDHLPLCGIDDKQKYMRCRNKNCTMKTRFKCVKCNVFLCITPERQCFFEFHS